MSATITFPAGKWEKQATGWLKQVGPYRLHVSAIGTYRTWTVYLGSTLIASSYSLRVAEARAAADEALADDVARWGGDQR